MVNISVCMATYNGEKYIKEQLDSILPQLGEEDEVIVSDDGSTDGTLDIVRSYQDQRIFIFENELEHGFTKNFENALNHSHGRYIFISDQDDIWMKDKVRVMCEALKTWPLVVHDATVTDGELNVRFESFFDHYNIQQGFLRTLLKTRYTGACMAMRREFLDRALPFPDNQDLCPYDYWFAYLGEYHHECRLLRVPLILYRRHENTALHAGEYSTRSLREKVETRLYCLKHLMNRK
ncbi:MAG: glycosyltransferase family 2 protein [Solobacterium sp.]|nr:glycosyltransferase family 2 protein [Solobacterium sp.]